jgi:hypothetical protein
MSRGGRKTHAHDDQYGEVGRGDDGDARDDGARSTGGAGARKGAKGSVAYVRRLPKFLEAHAGLLGATTTTRDDDDARRCECECECECECRRERRARR